jgi:hypothetical protein
MREPDMELCQCGSREVVDVAPVGSDNRWHCAACGALVACADNAELDEYEAVGPPEFGMSALQWGQKWSTNFWAQLVRRVRNGEVTINLQKFTEKLARFIPGASDRKAPGRRRGGPFRDREHCLAWLRTQVSTCVKEDWPVTKERIGQLGGGTEYLRTKDPESAAKTITRWCDRYDIDFAAEVKKYFQK